MAKMNSTLAHALALVLLNVFAITRIIDKQVGVIAAVEKLGGTIDVKPIDFFQILCLVGAGILWLCAIVLAICKCCDSDQEQSQTTTPSAATGNGQAARTFWRPGV